MPSVADTATIKYLENLWEEGRAAQADTTLARAQSHIDFQRGQQWPKQLPRNFPDFVMNLVDDIIQRKAGYMTDARPVMDVTSSNSDVNARPMILETLKKCVHGVWDQQTWSEELARGIEFCQVVGCNIGMMGWDPLADNGRGDVRARWFDPRHFVCDPGVIAAMDLQESEYCGTEEVRAKMSLVEQYGERAMDCTPSTLFSSYPSHTRGDAGILSPTLAGRQFRRQEVAQITSQIPRCLVRNLWFKDFKRDSRGAPIYYEQGRPARRLIRHVVYAGDVVLIDEPNPNWHHQYPYEILDWGLELDHPWGASEVHKLRRAQETLNKIASQIIRNTILTNNIKVIGDSNALDAEQWDRLTNRPALILRKRQGTEIAFESPPALPAYLFELLQFLVKAMDLISGMGEVTRGAASPSQSGVALESLAIASQTLIRLQARRMEAFIQRLWTKAIPLFFQHYGLKRTLRIVGAGETIEPFLWDRAALFAGIVKPDDLFQDFALHVKAGTSLAIARIQKATLAMNLKQLGIVPGVDVLRAADWPDPEQTYERAQKEQMLLGLAGVGGGGGGSMNGGRRPPASFPAGAPTG
jgi:hypothetical protein